MPDLISVIVTTYNWPEALAACLNSLLAQTDQQFEIIIADDGSTASTTELVSEYINRHPDLIQHVFQEDIGFRAATIRNKAVTISKGDYLIFLDGDCVVFPHFISRHRKLAEYAKFIPGNRILVSEHYTPRLLKQQLPLHLQSFWFFIQQRLQGNINRLLPLCYLPWSSFRYWQANTWQKAMTCNLGIWKQDFIAINGFDESFQGWGYEDSDLVIRLLHAGIKRKEGRFALPVLHLWHKQHDRSQHDHNYARLMSRVADKSSMIAAQGIQQYLSD